MTRWKSCPDERVVVYQHDALGRIEAVADTVNGATTAIASGRSFLPDGLLPGQGFGNDLNELRQYDTQGDCTTSRSATPTRACTAATTTATSRICSRCRRSVSLSTI